MRIVVFLWRLNPAFLAIAGAIIAAIAWMARASDCDGFWAGAFFLVGMGTVAKGIGGMLYDIELYTRCVK